MKITFTSPTADLTGYAELARTLIASLYKVGADVAVDVFSLEKDRTDTGEFGKICAELARKNHKPDINVITMIPPLFKQFRKPGCLNVGLTMFETDKLPADWVAQINEMDAILVPAQWNKEVFINSDVKVPVEVAPPGIEVPDYVSSPNKVPFVFLSCFEWTARKNPEGLLKAFWTTFTGSNAVELHIKTYRRSRTEAAFNEIYKEAQAVKSSLKLSHFPAVEFITDALSNEKMADLYRNCHAFVLPTKAEGLGLPFMTAMAHGRPTIGTNWSGQTEFMNDKNSLLVEYNLTPVSGMNGFHNFYDGTMNWAEPHLDSLRDQMLHAYNNSHQAAELGRAGRETMKHNFSLKGTAENLLGILEKWNKELR